MKRIGRQNKAGSGENKESTNTSFKLAPFNPSSDQIQHKALGMLDLKHTDVLFDVGCGDGRFLCFAATKIPGLRCVGIEIDPLYVSRAKDLVQTSELEEAIDIRLEDATRMEPNDDDGNQQQPQTTASSADVTELTLMDDATAVYLFILPKGIVKIMPLLESLKQKRLAEGKRLQVLSYMFGIHDWKATEIDETAKGSCPVYYYDFGGAAGGE